MRRQEQGVAVTHEILLHQLLEGVPVDVPLLEQLGTAVASRSVVVEFDDHCAVTGDHLAVGAEQRTFANYAEARRAAYEDGIIPMQKEFSATINRVLLPLLGDPRRERFEFDYSRVQCLSESVDARFVRYGDAYQKNKLVVLNEARVALGLEPAVGGDRFADGSTLADGPQAPAPPPPPAPSGPPKDEEPPADETADETKALVAESRELMARVRLAFPEPPP